MSGSAGFFGRRPLLKGTVGAAAVGLVPAAARGQGTASVRVADGDAGWPIDPWIYGDNEIGDMDGGLPSVDLAARGGVTFRRLGGNLMSTYNWHNNASNAGKDWQHANLHFLPGALGMPEAERAVPNAVVDRALANARAIGARLLMTVPLAGFVAADTDGPVPPEAAAPSNRFASIDWTDRPADAAMERGTVNIPQGLRRLVARHGRADRGGIAAYALDNEPGLWPETHPRIRPSQMPIAAFLDRSVAAARAIRAVDPSAPILGPVAWGLTGLLTFHNAPDWPEYRRRYPTFLACYLDRFRQASEADGRPLLDAVDTHWYAFHRAGELFRSEDPGLAETLMEMPRELDEPGYRGASWVGDTLAGEGPDGLSSPILPSLKAHIDTWFPGLRLAVTEYNFGGQGQVAAGIAVADALGRFGRQRLMLATHWGSLEGMLNEAFRLYRDYDGLGSAFGETGLPAETSDPATLSAYAARSRLPTPRLHIVVLNKDRRERSVTVATDGAGAYRVRAAYGFDADRPVVGPLGPVEPLSGAQFTAILPARSARHFVLL